VLEKVSGIVISEARENDNHKLTLVEQRWNDEISKVSRVELEQRIWNKLQLTSDIKKLKVSDLGACRNLSTL